MLFAISVLSGRARALAVGLALLLPPLPAAAAPVRDAVVLTVEPPAPAANLSPDSAGLFLEEETLHSFGPAILPYMLRLHNGNLLAAFSRPTGPFGSNEPYVAESADGGLTWSAMVKVAPSFGSRLLAGGMVELADGTVLMAYHDGHLNGGDPIPPATSRIRIARRPPGSTAWDVLSTVHQSGLVGLWEGTLTLLPNGKLLCHFASEEQQPEYPNAIFQSESLDGGLTWTPPRRIIGVPGSRDGVPSVIRLPGGRLLCFFEAQDWWHIDTIPTDFYIAYVYSDDDGQTWSTERRVVSVPASPENGHRHTAPQAALLPNGKILVTFYSSDGYPPRPIDRYTDMMYVESDAPYTSWTVARKLIGEPLESDRWGFLLPRDNTTLDFMYTRDVTGTALSADYYRSVYRPNIADNFADRIVLSGTRGSWSGSTSDATREPNEPAHDGRPGNKSAWWSFTPPFSGTLRLDTAGSNFDTMVGLYTGDSLGSLQYRGSNDNAGPGTLTSALVVPVTAGLEYKIAVDGANRVAGFVTLNWNLCQEAPAGPALTSPSHGARVDTIPLLFDWEDAPGAQAYDVILDGAVAATVTDSSWMRTAPLDVGSHTWQIRARNDCGVSLSPIRNFLAHDLRMVSGDFSPSAPEAVVPGQLLNASWTLSGSSTEGKRVWFELFASRSGGFDLERFGGTVTQSFSSAHAGGQATYSPGTQRVTTIPDGLYTLVASVNRPETGGGRETNPYNNHVPIAGKRLFVHNPTPPTSDLTWKTPPVISVDGRAVNVSGTVTNAGTAASPAYGFWIETVYGQLSPEGNFMIHGWLGSGSRVATALEPGQTRSYTNSGMLPAGDWAVAVLIDSTDLVPEVNESNNFQINRTPPPMTGTVDLEILAADIDPSQKAPAQVQPGSPLNWWCTVRNNSSTDSGPVWFELFASQTGGLDTIRSGTALTASDKRNVPAGQTVTLHFARTLNTISDGIYTPVVMVNRRGLDGPDDPVPASNRRVISGRVFLRSTRTAGANLVWQTEPVLTRNGNQITVTGTVCNAGTQASGPFWTELFEGAFNASGMFARTGAIGGGIHNPGLAPGATWTYTRTLNHPRNHLSVGILIDSTDIVPESDETDNYRYF